MSNILLKFVDEQIKRLSESKEFPSFRPGDTLSVDINIAEDDGIRVQNFTGVCIARRSRGINSSFVLRKISSSGSAVERKFPLYSPTILKITVLKCGRVRRAKLYYMRNLFGKAARIPERKSLAGGKAKKEGI